MISLDTTFLIDLWRVRAEPSGPLHRILIAHAAEVFTVPAHAAGEFLEGGASVSDVRLQDALAFLRTFEIGVVSLETAGHYARMVATLRRTRTLAGLSKPDIWIAAWAMEHGCPLVTRNVSHFSRITGLPIITYEI